MPEVVDKDGSNGSKNFDKILGQKWKTNDMARENTSVTDLYWTPGQDN